MPEGFSDKILCYFLRAAIINHDKLGGLKGWKYVLMVLKFRSLIGECHQGLGLSEDSWEASFLAPPWTLAAPDSPWLSLACGCVILTSASVFPWPFLPVCVFT